ncbi:MAG: hypothetical protein ACRCZZ_08875 [Phocaeicola sp.]
MGESRLVIVTEVEPKIYTGRWGQKIRSRRVLVKCECGTEKVIALSGIQSNTVKSCGCYKKEYFQKNGFQSNPQHFFNGKSIREWSEETGIDIKVLKARLLSHGWTIERATTTPVKKRASRLANCEGGVVSR